MSLTTPSRLMTLFVPSAAEGPKWIASQFQILFRYQRGSFFCCAGVAREPGDQNTVNLPPDSQLGATSGNRAGASAAPLLAAPEFLLRLLRAITQPFAVLSGQGRFLLSNPAFEQLSGYEPRELAAVSPAALFATENPEADRAALFEVIAAGGSRSGVTTWQTRAGQEIPVELCCSRLELPSGEPVLLLLAENLSERQRLEA